MADHGAKRKRQCGNTYSYDLTEIAGKEPGKRLSGRIFCSEASVKQEVT